MNPVRASLRFPQVTLALTAMLFIGGVMKFSDDAAARGSQDPHA